LSPSAASKLFYSNHGLFDEKTIIFAKKRLINLSMAGFEKTASRLWRRRSLRKERFGVQSRQAMPGARWKGALAWAEWVDKGLFFDFFFFFRFGFFVDLFFGRGVLEIADAFAQTGADFRDFLSSEQDNHNAQYD
jgi:hypothetical protein